jgi:predicted AlkP superfamily pyrophosphatase or phosphodiesterase
MRKTVVINVVGLTRRLIGEHTPFLRRWAAPAQVRVIEPVLPAVTCTAQATYLTGKLPAEHGIVANGWYFAEECEIKFWRQSNRLVQAPKIWEMARKKAPTFTCANLFWWYNMYSAADVAVTPRPNYLADGRKIPDIYTTPAEWRDTLRRELGQFPLFHFWGPNTSIKSSRWIAEAAKLSEARFHPDLTLIYLPHLDYNLQRRGQAHPSIASDLREIDAVLEDLVAFYERSGARTILLSEYGITDVRRPVHLNRRLREEGLLALRREQSWELLDPGSSSAFAAADHQAAHVYVNDKSRLNQVRAILENTEGVELVLDKAAQAAQGLAHPRSGDLLVVADAESWFTYYYWLDDRRAPDFARTVDIHRKPGYDPAEMFIDPRFRLPMLAAAWRLFKRKLGFRVLMDLIPIHADMVRGSHGRRPENPADWPVWIDPAASSAPEAGSLPPEEVCALILECLFERNI